MNDFEVLTANGGRFKHKGVYWQYASIDGHPDRLDKTCVEILNDDDEIIQRYSQVVRIGNVDDESCLEFPRERLGIYNIDIMRQLPPIDKVDNGTVWVLKTAKNFIRELHFQAVNGEWKLVEVSSNE